MKNRLVKRIYRRILYMTVFGLKLILGFFPRRFNLALGKIGGYLCFILLPGERKRALKNLGMVFDAGDTKRIGRKAFVHLGMNFMEWINLPRLNPLNFECWFKADGLERIDRVLKKGRGGIILSAHLGNWEYMAAYLFLKGYTGRVLVREIYYKPYDTLLKKMRESAGVMTINRNGSIRSMLKVLKENKLLGILPDQDTNKVEGVFIDFFGRAAYTPTGPVVLAMASKSSIIPCFIARENGKHHIYVEEPFEIEGEGDKEEITRRYTQKWSKILEGYIRRFPDQWVWMHKRWRGTETSNFKIQTSNFKANPKS